MSGAAEIVFDRVTKRYAGRDGAALDQLSLTITAGTFCVLVGPSGGGKTTALKLVNRLLLPTAGAVVVDGPVTGTIRRYEMHAPSLPRRRYLNTYAGLTSCAAAPYGWPVAALVPRWCSGSEAGENPALSRNGEAPSRG